MKIRNGFVSNSSSSSFILGLDHFPVDVNDLKRMVFKDRTTNIGKDWGDESLDLDTAAEMIYSQITWMVNGKLQNKPIKTLRGFINAVDSGNFGYDEDYNKREHPHDIYAEDFRRKYGISINGCDKSHPVEYKEWWKLIREDIENEHKRIHELATDYCKTEWEKFKDKYIVEVGFSDNDGSAHSLMEHGDAWDDVLHIRISNH